MTATLSPIWFPKLVVTLPPFTTNGPMMACAVEVFSRRRTPDVTVVVPVYVFEAVPPSVS